jgi:hypothetical protein
MKTTIKIALIAICYFAINITATAQGGKVLRPRTTAPTTIPTPNPTPAPADPTLATEIKAVDVSIYGKKIPKQDPQKAKFTGTIKIDADSLIKITDDETYGSYIIFLNGVKYNLSEPTPAGGLVQFEYSFTNQISSTWYKNVVVTKVNDREYNYTIYNVPLNTGVVVGLQYKDPSGAAGSANGGPIKNMKITGAFSTEQIFSRLNQVNASPNYQATIAGQVLTFPTITISNPPVQPN